ncbi:hypothetical protein KPL74_01675 [Bacillus sp. NP157]|nr:hypothetical protein KPL74_01675 [Bacillus sp. NP157]
MAQSLSGARASVAPTVAVHVAGEPTGFARRWIPLLESRGVNVLQVNCFGDDAIDRLKGADALMWHWSHSDARAVLMARQLLASVEAAGKVVFPALSTGWHFDDKVGQKYLLEAIGAPLVPTHVFVQRESALAWIEQVAYPLVSKLRGGAGSQNVRLVRDVRSARAFVRRAFGRGIPPLDRTALLRDRFVRLARKPAMERPGLALRAIARWLVPSAVERVKGRESGYVYFQDFLPGNRFDTRVVVIGGRAFGLRRFNRDGDFRASGSGKIDYDASAIDPRCVEIAFAASRKLGAQCLAYDFVFDQTGAPLIVEVSYGFTSAAYDACEGFWTEDLAWHAGRVEPEAWMVDGIMAQITESEVV